MSTVENIPVQEVKPLHEVRNPKLVKELAADMRENGWQGRPLLVVKRDSGYLAWTGSHRLAAAAKAGLDSVPCHVLDERELLQRGFDADWGHVDDSDRLQILRKLGDETALHLMWLEGRQ